MQKYPPARSARGLQLLRNLTNSAFFVLGQANCFQEESVCRPLGVNIPAKREHHGPQRERAAAPEQQERRRGQIERSVVKNEEVVAREGKLCNDGLRWNEDRGDNVVRVLDQ